MVSGRVIMITGASSGIGAAAARLFAAEGASVVLMARREEALRNVAREITEAGGIAVCAPGDVVRSVDVRQAVQTAMTAFGRLDCAFNNAGWGTVGHPLHEVDDEIYDQIMDVNLRGVWNCMRAQLPPMLETGVGAIVNTASVAGVRATRASAPYIAAKHAVIGLTRAAAADYGQLGIRVNALVVGSTRTELLDHAIEVSPGGQAAPAGLSAQQRMASPDEIAQAAAWLCSGRSSFVTGTALAVDGGRTAQ
ncbi:SDR family NAD(P)-dependent oxidoreductase [Streptomyces boninensis]|uniref:SDR family NAD(P)-dependent oxidoreductase n=1 Tax=Streptomyces boninensis TaxID=2039455 RepID=UPI003B21B4A0